ncbi:MerR family DNA-binding protein [uncultured Sneathiella sp.]|jgi:Hg(II)-responsive transcriptional regulator|uniref:MerR family DNA-binding protein n=1 Tax=uncultured Sneathiella sp. TaxID=879315 RepID=UPI0030D83A32|tara:strand:+ start:1056 stop:1739 length:684 start_codon:yes stop_codon:yes gene_type:complete
MTQFTISRAAKAANVNVETIRFYERKGLIVQPPKPVDGGAREYDQGTVTRIRFIRQAQEIGFSLQEISELLSLRADPGADCADVRSRAVEKRDEVQEKLRHLSQMRDALDELIASCPGGGDVVACTILDAMARGTPSTSPEITNARQTPLEGTKIMKTTILHIDGMHCDGCALTIEALLSRTPGVRKAEASYDERRVRILHDQAEAPVADLLTAIAKGGFKGKVTDQ